MMGTWVLLHNQRCTYNDAVNDSKQLGLKIHHSKEGFTKTGAALHSNQSALRFYAPFTLEQSEFQACCKSFASIVEALEAGFTVMGIGCGFLCIQFA